MTRYSSKKSERERECADPHAMFCSRCGHPHSGWIVETGQGTSCASSFAPSGWGSAHYGSTRDGDRFLSAPASRALYATPTSSDSVCDACLMGGVLAGELFFFDEDWRPAHEPAKAAHARLAENPQEALEASRESWAELLRRRAQWERARAP